jgi:Uma2 family endonuclease
MESSLHYLQLALLVSCLEWLWQGREDFFIGANLTVYFSRNQLKREDVRGPDLFLVKGVDNHPRKSWVVWEEDGKYPDLVIELLSESTATSDRTVKKQLYQDRWRTPEYFWFSPDTLEFAGWRLVGHEYEAIEETPQGRRWSQELELYLGVLAGQLRYFRSTGELVPTPLEAAQQERQLAEQERQLAEQERQRSERLAARLRELGDDPNQY